MVVVSVDEIGLLRPSASPTPQSILHQPTTGTALRKLFALASLHRKKQRDQGKITMS